MTTHGVPILKKISDSDRTVASSEEDVRGRKVCGAAGDDLGTVEDLLIDEEEGKVRFLLVGHGGFLGIGEKSSFVPVDAVTRVTEDRVYVDRSREHVAGAPAYDPGLVDETSYYGQVYDHYGYGPFWGPGYVYPGFPLFRP
ncbi:PRC-barrel domain containing protein [Streptomyces sp. WAC05374]|uniref:PRC-barrel domain-containing protein n=1 Tax=Streptomyces sp. WAC05374 TaxID=2487420 RepID=UPI000F88736F|nr:PRC-barrel domain-containing protein [Streptomyces sp. WAC05374]RST15983.1 PRC-barrel domain containing protein [Streptomyces sp. WAC05374]TDF47870.1 PRC-barrel domain containing protein [Streptomyces sp. WAC05374]TDF53979.1 PRC-barrel domain containing protein [Streptomyces sp. WAC05374]